MSFSPGMLSLWGQGIGAITSAIGSYTSAQGQKNSLQSQAEIDAINATTADNAARAAMLAGQREEQRSMISTANLKSSQQVGFAANGVDMGEGSAERTLTSTDVLGKIDANTIAANAVRNAWGYRTQATNIRNDALMKNAAASAISPTMSAVTSLMGSAGSVSANWYQMKKLGMLGNGTQPSGGIRPQDVKEM